MSEQEAPQKRERKQPGKKPLRVKIDLDPEEALRRLLAPKAKRPRKSGSAS